MPTDAFAASLLRITSMTGMSVAVSLLVCSVFDYAIQWYGFQQRNRITDQELREEIRRQTGGPQIARIRHQRMREITRDRMQQGLNLHKKRGRHDAGLFLLKT